MGPVAALAVTFLIVEAFTLPIFRSGGRTGLSFFGWVVNHTGFGPAVEYVPEEDYARELEGVKVAGLIEGPAPAPEDLETVMAYLKISEPSARRLLAGNGSAQVNSLKQYYDLKADVRHGEYHSIRQLVQPDQPEVRELARVLVQADDFVAASQDFIDSFTTYQRQIGDYWAMPSETLEARAGDCDDKAILLCSILRNYMPAEDVFCAVGTQDGEGHMWVVMANSNGEDRIVEATAPSSKPVKDNYRLYAIFNDQYAFSYPEGIREFCLKPVEEKELVAL